MTDRELDERIAMALGWVIHVDPAPYFTQWWVGVDGQATETPGDFYPSTSVDALRKWVLPELVRRGVFAQWVDSVISKTQGMDAWKMMKNAKIRVHLIDRDPAESSYAVAAVLFLSPPSVLAAAALAVLEEDNDSRL